MRIEYKENLLDALQDAAFFQQVKAARTGSPPPIPPGEEVRRGQRRLAGPREPRLAILLQDRRRRVRHP